MRTTPNNLKKKTLTRTYLYTHITNIATSITYFCQQQLSLSERDRHAKTPNLTLNLFFPLTHSSGGGGGGAFCSHTRSFSVGFAS